MRDSVTHGCNDDGNVVIEHAFDVSCPRFAPPQVVQKAAGTADFLSQVQTAAQTYLSEAIQANAAAALIAPDALRWRRRPDLHAVAVALAPLGWRLDTVRAKLTPLWMEWDMRRGPAALLLGTAAAAGGATCATAASAAQRGRDLAPAGEAESSGAAAEPEIGGAAGAEQQAMFYPVAIKKVAGGASGKPTVGAGDGDDDSDGEGGGTQVADLPIWRNLACTNV